MKSYFKTLFLTVTMLLFSQVLLAQWQGAGTAQNPFKIYNVNDLNLINSNETAFNSYQGIHFELMNDINDTLFYKLGTNFRGYFHGKNHYITLGFKEQPVSLMVSENVLFDKLYGTVDSLTLFGKVTNFMYLFSTIEPSGKLLNIVSNLVIEPSNYDMGFKNMVYSSVFCAGNYGIIENCINNSDLQNEQTGNVMLSVFCGINNCGQIINCVNNGNITITVTGQDDFVWCYIFCSESNYTYNSAINPFIINCINTGNINIIGIPSAAYISIFSFANNCQVLNCINTGNINARKTDIAGIFSAYNCNTIRNCINTGNLTGEVIAGGIAGICDLYDGNPNSSSIVENCLNTNYIFGNSETGGIVGTFNISVSKQAIVKNNLDISKTNGYALFGNTDETVFQKPNIIFENNFYDKQMVTQEATIIGDVTENNAAKGLLTIEITGFALQDILGDGWSYAEGRYPIPLGLENHPAALLAATPVFLHYTDQDNYNSVDSVSEHFKVGVETGAEWQTSYNNVAINGQKAKLQHIGYENLKASIDNFSKNIIINIKNVPEDIYYTVNGTVKSNGEPLENVTILYSDTYTLTDENGYYSFEILEDENVTVTPSLQGYTFIPTDSTINNIMQNIENVNFAANTTGIYDVAVQKLIFYPNPVKDVLKIKNEELKIENYTIFNVAGQVLMQGTLSDKTINVKSLQSGMYFIKIGNITGKFIKK